LTGSPRYPPRRRISLRLRRLWTFLVDLADAIVAAALYGGQGGLTYTTSSLEADNAHKLRRWAAGGKVEEAQDEPDPEVVGVEERIRRFRKATSEPREG